MSGIFFDYSKEPSRDILCIDCKSFYASCECVDRGLDPLKAKLVVMSYPSNNPKERGSGLVLASSPMAKKNMVLLMLPGQESCLFLILKI